jgi:hypothetical protein
MSVRVSGTFSRYLLGLACAGCGATSIKERHVVQAADQQGHTAYYRLSLEADADLAKTNYRAGLYDAAAIDALFGNVSPDENTIDETLERRRREAVDTLSKAYYDSLSRPEQEQAAARKALEQALAPVPRRQKFVVVYSANASAVMQAIADFSEEEDTRNAVLSLIAPFKRDDFLSAKSNSEALKRAVAAVVSAREALDKMTDPAAGKEADAAYKDQIQRILNDLLSAAER